MCLQNNLGALNIASIVAPIQDLIPAPLEQEPEPEAALPAAKDAAPAATSGESATTETPSSTATTTDDATGKQAFRCFHTKPLSALFVGNAAHSLWSPNLV